ncbi:MAG: hypothetical protein VYC39_00490 [Myxococcota bacterium]|nr:hypothetical protein [Myxococcota bacterium]
MNNQHVNQPSNLSRSNRSVKSLLLDRHFQLKYTSMIVGVAALLSLALGGFLVSKVNENSRILGLENLGDAAFEAHLFSADNELVMSIAISLALFLVLLIGLSIVMTHRVVGPIYVIKRHLDALAAGRLPQIRGLRKGDEFVDCHQSLVNAIDQLHNELERDIDVLSAALDVLETQGEEHESGLQKELKSLVTQKRGKLSTDSKP